MERKENSFIIYDKDLERAREIAGWIGIGVLLVESIRLFVRITP